MPYLLLILGLIIGAYALYRFFINANTKQIKAMFLTAAIAALVIALFFMAVTGRLPAALGLADGASDTQIKAAYKKLMQKVHPDHEGSEWMAAKLNQARDFLIKDIK